MERIPTDPENAEEGPLLAREQSEPAVSRIDRKKVMIGLMIVGVPIMLIMIYKISVHSAKKKEVQAPEPPRASDIRGGLSKLLDLPASYAGIDKTPKPPEPVKEKKIVEPPPVIDLPPMARPAREPKPPQEGKLPPPPKVARPVREVPKKQEAKEPVRWLFNQPKIGGPPFEKPQASSADQAQGLIKQAAWERPEDPTKVLYSDQVIYGTTLGEINSSIPGHIRIMVTRPVTDILGQGRVIVPQHSLIIAKQEGRPGFGESRLRLAVEKIRFPDGTVVEVGGQIADRSGAAGLGGKVNNHYVKIGAAAFLSAALTVGTRGAFGNTRSFQETLPQQFAREAGQDIAASGRSIIDRSLNIPPTITEEAGAQVTIQFEENISFQTPVKIVKK